MSLDILKKLEHNKETLKKLDKYIQTLNKDSNDYYQALCYKALIFHNLGQDEDALKLLLPLENKLWCLKKEEIITLCDILKDISFSLNRADDALKYINLKEKNLLLIDHDKYTKDLIEYYHFIKDYDNEKRQIFIFLDENIDENQRIDVYERLFNFAYEDSNLLELNKYYDILYNHYSYIKDYNKLSNINILKCRLLLIDNIQLAYDFSNNNLSETNNQDEKVFYAYVCIKYFIASNNLRKATTVESNFHEMALKSSENYKIEYLKEAKRLYEKLDNKYSIDLISKEIDDIKPQEELTKTKVEKISKSDIKKINLIESNIVNNNINVSDNKFLNDKHNDSDIGKKNINDKKELSFNIKIDNNLDLISSSYYELFNKVFIYLNDSDLKLREQIRKSLQELNKIINFKEVHCIYKNDSFKGFQYKDSRLYDKSFNINNIKDTLLYNSYLNKELYYTKDKDKDIITLKESLFNLRMIIPICSETSLGSIAFYFNDEISNNYYEILYLFSNILSYKIKEVIKEDFYKLENKLDSFYINNINIGYKKIIDNHIYLNETSKSILNINTLDLSLDDYLDLINSIDKVNYKACINNLKEGKSKFEHIIYKLYDGRTLEEYLYLYELKESLIVVSSICDISDKILNDNKLIKESYKDSLTTIKSYKNFIKDLEEYNKTKKYSVMLIDAKDFKYYSDIYGIKFHNDLIKAIGLKLNNLSVKYESVSYHYDSDKFLIIIPKNDERTTIKVFNKLLDDLTEELYNLNNRVRLYFNGVILRVLQSSSNFNNEKILDKLSFTLSGLKENNLKSNTLIYYNSDLYDKAYYDFELELHISEAIDSGLIKLTYDTVVSFNTNDIFAYKARVNLINFNTTYDHFESIIKKRKLEELIDKYIICHSLMEMNKFKEKLKGVYHLIIPLHKESINQEFINYIYEQLRFLKISPKNVYFQIDDYNFLDLNLEYINLITNSIDYSIKYKSKFYITSFSKYSIDDLVKIKDFLQVYNINIIVFDVNNKEEIDSLTKLGFDYIMSNIVKANYDIDDIISSVNKE